MGLSRLVGREGSKALRVLRVVDGFKGVLGIVFGEVLKGCRCFLECLFSMVVFACVCYAYKSCLRFSRVSF